MSLILVWYMGLETIISPRVDMLSIRGEITPCRSYITVNKASY